MQLKSGHATPQVAATRLARFLFAATSVAGQSAAGDSLLTLAGDCHLPSPASGWIGESTTYWPRYPQGHTHVCSHISGHSYCLLFNHFRPGLWWVGGGQDKNPAHAPGRVGNVVTDPKSRLGGRSILGNNRVANRAGEGGLPRQKHRTPA